jgi:hypothetical protein
MNMRLGALASNLIGAPTNFVSEWGERRQLSPNDASVIHCDLLAERELAGGYGRWRDGWSFICDAISFAASGVLISLAVERSPRVRRSGIVVCVVVNTIILLVLSVVVSTRIWFP